MTPRQVAGSIAVALIASGCPARFDPRAEPIAASSPDPSANQAYRDAKARLDRGDAAGAEEGFADFGRRFPSDPLVPSASLWRARAALSLGAAERAGALVGPLVDRAGGDPVGDRARFLLGLALARSSRPDEATRARELLRPFASLVEGSADAVELHASLAEASARLGDPGDALHELGVFWVGATPVERHYIGRRGEQLASSVKVADLPTLYGAAPSGSLGRALLGRRLAMERQARGDAAGAKAILDETEDDRRHFELDGAAPGGRASTELTLGLVLPLSGKNRLLGEHALRGALLASDGIPAGAGSLDLRVRDSQSSPERAAAAVDELAAQGVAAVIGSPDRNESQAASARAEALGLPFLELAPDEGRRGSLVFKLIRANPSRAEALADVAVARRVSRVALLVPDNAYARRMADAFAARVEAAHITVAARIPYEEKATTFIAPVKKVIEAHVDALFVPAPAAQLELIASQLYASGVTRSETRGKNKTKAALLLATADGATSKLVSSAGRYLQGAVLAPVFYPDAIDPTLGPLVARFRDAYSEDPGTADALAYDAVRAVRVAAPPASESSADGLREAVARRLSIGAELGATGMLGFGAGGERAGEVQLFTVAGDGIHVVRPRAADAPAGKF